MYNEYLVHYGVKGMKWGVRHNRRKEGRAIAKELNSRDRKMQALTIEEYNARKESERLSRKSPSKSADKNARRNEKIKALNALSSDLRKQYVKEGRAQIDAVLKAEKQGYTWKARNTDFNQSQWREYRGVKKNIKAKYGARNVTNPLFNQANASSGNRFVVKPTELMTETKQDKYKRRQNIKRHTPQRVTTHYY